MPKGMTFDHEKVSFNIARYKKEGRTFEVVIDPDLAVKFAEGEEIDIKDILKSEKIFSDAKKGELAADLQSVFDTEEALSVAEKIIKQGEIQLTSEYRAKVREQKKKQLLQIIHRNGVDPRSKLPHPMVRLENAFEEAKIKIDERKKVEDQVQEVLKQLSVVLPIRFELKEISVHIPSAFAGKAYGTITNFGKILKEEWQNDGSWICVVEIPGGLESEFFDKLNNITHGDMESKIVKTK